MSVQCLLLQLKVPERLRPQVHSGVTLGMLTLVCWQGLLKKDPNWLCARPDWLKCMWIHFVSV